MLRPVRQVAVLPALLLLAACATTVASTPPPPVTLAAVGEVRAGTGIPNGYVPQSQIPDSLALLPPPPEAASGRFAADREAYQTAATSMTPARWEQAARDAALLFPASVKSFGDVLGITISTEATPHLAMLMQRTLVDAGLSTHKAKAHYQRTRPFVANNTTTCYPPDEKSLRTDGSYPSGHSAIGWVWALVLTQVVPDKTDALLQRGFDFGQSRVVCRAHWQSDVEAGRVMAAAAFARLQSDPVYQAQLALARAEVAAAQSR